MTTNKRRRSFLFLILFIGFAWILVVTPKSWAEFPRGGHDSPPNAAAFIGHVLKAKDKLGLSDEQEARLMAISLAFKKEDVRKTAEVELAELDLHQLLYPLLQRQQKQAGGDDIEGAVRKMYALKADRRLVSIRAFQESRSVLTAEQEQKFLRELREHHHESALPSPPPHGAFPPPPPRGSMER